MQRHVYSKRFVFLVVNVELIMINVIVLHNAARQTFNGCKGLTWLYYKSQQLQEVIAFSDSLRYVLNVLCKTTHDAV